MFYTPQEISLKIAEAVRAKRLSLNISQLGLSERSGVSFGVIKKFERTGQISLISLLKIASALDALDGFMNLFQTPPELPSLDVLLKQKIRKKGRR